MSDSKEVTMQSEGVSDGQGVRSQELLLLLRLPLIYLLRVTNFFTPPRPRYDEPDYAPTSSI